MRREGRSLSAVLSFGQGIIHSHYTVALAPAIGALVGVGSVELWRRRDDRAARALLAGTLAVTAVWAWMLLTRTPDFAPWLRVAVFIVGLAAAGGLFVESQLPRSRLGAAVAGAALLAGLAGPAAYALDTAASPHSGTIPSAGPSAGLGSDSCGFGRQNGGADTSRQIAAWVMQHFTARTIDGVTIYDLTAVAP